MIELVPIWDVLRFELSCNILCYEFLIRPYLGKFKFKQVQ